MAVEKKRGCGFRKIGGLYLVSEAGGAQCDRLPFELDICPCCGQGIKPARSWTWITPEDLFSEDHFGEVDNRTHKYTDDKGLPQEAEIEEFKPCRCEASCPVCYVTKHFEHRERAGLLWIGDAHYKTPHDFTQEGALQGFSRRIAAIPMGFSVGKTWVFLAHRHCVKSTEVCPDCRGTGLPVDEDRLAGKIECALCKGSKQITVTMPAIFLAWRPQRIERMVKQSEYESYTNIIRDITPRLLAGERAYKLVPDTMESFWRLHRDVDRGITLVPLPDDDPDHQAKPNGDEHYGMFK